MSYHHITITERIKIETYLELGLKTIQIARKLGVHKSTLLRELKRCSGTYSAQSAQICSRYQLENKPMVSFKTIYNWLYAGMIDCDLSV